MFPKRLSQRIFNHSYARPLSTCIDVTLSLPISARKIIITSCQMGEVDIRDFSHVSFPTVLSASTHAKITGKDFLECLVTVTACPISSSILWMIARTCPEPPNDDQSEQVSYDGFWKEMSASMTTFSSVQQISYSAFFRTAPGINDPGQWWVNQTSSIATNFIKGVRGHTIFPVVQRQKNVSDETAAIFISRHPSYNYVRTVDLEVHYHHTGERIGGLCETRSAWKFNDLKPRIYYCIGGEQYWPSTYMKVVAVKLMEAIPSTSVKLRTSPADYLNSDVATDTVTAWDFTSFTTTLSELKYFIWYIARILEREKVTVTLFDYRFGFQQAFLSEMLDEYNEVVNMNAAFGIHRMIGRFVEDNDLVDYVQQNNGMLGVPGNIGFSTALHGLVVCKACGVSRCVCVGDDALGITSDDPNTYLIPSLQKLGIIHPEKFGIIPPHADPEYAIKFLKRRFQRVGGTFTMSFLLNLPISPYIDGITGFRTLPNDFSLQARLYKICSQVGTLLWEVLEHPELSDTSIGILTDFLFECYRYLRIPSRGMLPGHSLTFNDGPNPETVLVDFTIPPLPGPHSFDPRREDWMDYLINHTPSLFFRGPMYVYKAMEDMDMDVMDSQMVAESPYVSALEDLGFLKVEKMSEWLLITNVTSQRVLRKMSRRVDDGMGQAVRVTCLKRITGVMLRAVFSQDSFTLRDSDLEHV